MNKIRRFALSLNTSSPVYGLGLLTDEPDYRLCWLLNQNYSWDLVRSDDILITDKNSSIPQSYACFESNANHQPAIKLIGNRSKEGLWLTVFQQVDFLLVVSVQDPAGQYLDELKSTIGTKIPQIRGLFKVPLPSFCYL
ncbi:MAG: hypothetical protein D4R64_03350 [Porphyromonadaceae bacterium]|nr:MAG: hypothetical protein D4R64_03350 [Porphyromonadaceae bacterium]